MIIKQNSWHYKLSGSIRSSARRPNNLCAYIRSVLLALLAWVFVIVLVGAGCLGVLLICVWIPFLSLSMQFGWMAIDQGVLITGRVFLICEVVVGLIALVIYLVKRYSCEIHEALEVVSDRLPKMTLIRKEGILMGALRDLKDKTCTMITYD